MGTTAGHRRQGIDDEAGAPLLRTAAHHCDGHVELVLVGELCASTAPQLADALATVLEDGARTVHVDLTGLALCTSDGVDVIERARRALADRDGSLVLDGATGVVARVLDILGTVLDDRGHTEPDRRRHRP